jgi:hypothetical protein
MYLPNNEGEGLERGPVQQVLLTATGMGLAVSVLASANVVSALLQMNGWQRFTVGLTSSQAGTLSVQRYLDIAGTIPQGAAVTAALTAATAAVVNAGSDLAPCASVQVTVSNSSGSTTANLTLVGAILQSA